jgi:hypothetical protein
MIVYLILLSAFVVLNCSNSYIVIAISNVSDLVKRSLDTNIVLINAPHRHDLIPTLCVNKEVWKYNRLLRKVAKLNTNIQFLELDLDRSHFTSHGMHINSKGKDQLSQQLAKQIDLIFNKPQFPPISIPWELTNPELTNTDPRDVNTNGNSIQHRRKCPRLKHPDFLWT